MSKKDKNKDKLKITWKVDGHELSVEGNDPGLVYDAFLDAAVVARFITMADRANLRKHYD